MLGSPFPASLRHPSKKRALFTDDPAPSARFGHSASFRPLVNTCQPIINPIAMLINTKTNGIVAVPVCGRDLRVLLVFGKL
jgi:hypothetical protein